MCFSKSPHQLVVVGSELAEKWTMSKDAGLSLVGSFDIAVSNNSSSNSLAKHQWGKTKLNIDEFHYESWKPIYFEVKRSKVKGQDHEAQIQCRRGSPVTALL